ncbi:hypothetical protein EFK50_07850 [Nocardioides marmoriginsengisoli]|uniref:DUF3168 domain-containing protein n=1 Tax=Nocardioides marmoriginsengisoli TaxID=661483 RepID=A0A3N0CJL0_9ACTN|nr:hypothetical protein [Nocardioides marmoriginsengisoli]RNL63647.1 hypothetical protein EFK50_07850 [Nocardioides marmoriginsengisoli]
MTAQANVDAILTVLNAALSPRKAYDLDKVPSTRPPQYVEITLARRFGANLKRSASTGIVGYRLTVAAVSQTTVSSVRTDLEECRAALEFNRLSVGPAKTTPIQFETNDDADYGSGWFAEYMTFTFAIGA